MRWRTILLVGILAFTLPPVFDAVGCDEVNVANGTSFTLCDTTRDGQADTVHFRLGGGLASGHASAYQQDLRDRGQLVGEFRVVTGVPFNPVVQSRTVITDRHHDGSPDNAQSHGGAYLTDPGRNNVIYFLALRDGNNNGQPEDNDLVVCDTITGCTWLL